MKRLLVIDDDPLVRSACRSALEGPAYELVTVPDILTGLERMRNGTIDLVFLDLNMPGLEGLSALRQLRALSRQVPILVITSFVDQYLSQIQIAATEGIDFDLMRKPLDRNDLRAITVAMLGMAARQAPQQLGNAVTEMDRRTVCAGAL